LVYLIVSACRAKWSAFAVANWQYTVMFMIPISLRQGTSFCYRTCLIPRCRMDK
jgi:hypothetical protein